MIHEYETVCILKPDLPGETKEKIKAKWDKVFSGFQTNLLAEKDWGRRQLSYPIQKINYGQYFYFNYQAEPSIVAELERTFKYEENIIRFLTVKLIDDVESGKVKDLKKITEIENSQEKKEGKDDHEGGQDA